MTKPFSTKYAMGTSILFLTLAVFGGSYHATVDAKAHKPKLSFSKVTLKEGATKKLKVKNTKKKITWSSNKKKVVTVNNKGILRAKKKGNAKITAKLGKKKLTCTVKVIANKKITSTNNPLKTNAPVTSSAPTLTPSVAPTVSTSPVPAITPAPTGWEVDKQSGTKEAFMKYFNPDLKEYTTQKDVPMGEITTITYPSTVIGEEREAYVYTPAGYSTDKTYPVLYLIHGIGCDGSQWVSMQLNNIISNMIASGEVTPFVAVCPSVVPPADKKTNVTLSPENIKAFTDFAEEFSKDLQPYIQTNYSVSKERKDTAVCGLSMGGMEALSLGFSHLEYFNYIGSFSAAPSLDTSLLTLENSTFTPSLIMISSGDADNTVGDNPKNYHETLVQNNVDHIWFQYPKQRHSGTVWQNGLVNFLQRIYRD